MKTLLTTFCLTIAVLLGSAGMSFALPPCPSDHHQYWHNCFGILTDYRGKYVGEFKDGKEHGQGTYTQTGSYIYLGEYKDGERHGQGTFTWKDGRRYSGEWRNGQANGRGIKTFPDGRPQQEGIFENDQFQYAQKVTPTVTAKKSSPPSPSAAEIENEKLHRRIAELEKQKQSKPKIDFALAKRTQEALQVLDLYAGKNDIVGVNEVHKLQRRIAGLEKQKQSKPKIDFALAKRTQEALQVLGLYAGKLDGVIGVRTRTANKGWQKRNGYPETGEITETQIVKLEQDATQHLAEQKSKPKKIAKKKPQSTPS
jgi:hypothetical protein